MKEADLRYSKLTKRLATIQTRTGLTESPAFLVWFLENIYRLEETEARDAVCDHTNDKGIDGIYVDHNEQEIHFLQAKIRQKVSGTIGDVGPKNLAGSAAQFSTKKKVETVLAGNADTQLKQLLVRTRVADLVDSGYRRLSVYVSNELHDTDSQAYEKLNDEIDIYDRNDIAARFFEVDAATGKPSFTFDVPTSSRCR